VAEIERTGTPASMTPGGKGQFDVLLDGRVLFSKQSVGRFPEPDEILGRVG
jgi:hypothetical protein